MTSSPQEIKKNKIIDYDSKIKLKSTFYQFIKSSSFLCFFMTHFGSFKSLYQLTFLDVLRIDFLVISIFGILKRILRLMATELYLSAKTKSVKMDQLRSMEKVNACTTGISGPYATYRANKGIPSLQNAKL